MFWHRHVSVFGTRVHGPALVPLVLAAVLVTRGLAGALPSAKGLVEWMAIVLLVWVAVALVHTSRVWRAFTRHDAIRADIAAAGGLGKRLMV